ncbi:hypothetical protein [Pseudomonas syringae group genomosp. 7]|uniref:hypothetical protein n=1 Tax=Pseudomonas syringae group genomosp. 7 TaxID=251699 RepID=UPI000EFE88E9|nr:hypothetical protein [Pseudomonas syringae group genomosp. 7]RMR07141.1 hypothetical protein ALP93_200237 [Pseudomonas syringae pv. helianthi]
MIDKGGAKLKGLRKTVYGGAAAAIGLFFAGLISYVVEHGELPAWSSGALSWLYSLMTLEAPLALWKVLLCILIPSLGFGTLVYYWGRKYDLLVDGYNEQNDLFAAAQVEKSKLEKENSKLKIAHEELLESVKALEATNSDLVKQNAELKESVALANELNQKQVEIDVTCLDVLKAIAALTERDLRADLESIDSIVRLGKIQTHAALDVLRRGDLISASGNVLGIRYRLTAQGRVYYLEHKDQ